MNSWHFHTGVLAHSRGTEIKEGQTLKRNPNNLKLCKYGLHSSERLMDAVWYAGGLPYLSYVKASGKIITGRDKIVSSRRKCIKTIDQKTLVRKIIDRFFCEEFKSYLGIFQVTSLRSLEFYVYRLYMLRRRIRGLKWADRKAIWRALERMAKIIMEV